MFLILEPYDNIKEQSSLISSKHSLLINRIQLSYKIIKEQVKYAIYKLKENEQITMEELYKIIKKKYKDFDITPQHF